MINSAVSQSLSSSDEASKKPIVSLRNIGKSFGNVTALETINIDIREGEIFALLGPSGCGKSTLLRIISGFETPTTGELLLDGQDMTKMPPNKRPVNMVFQSYAVFPHMSVADNVSYGLKMEKLPSQEISDRVNTVLDQVHLQEFKDRMPDQLSGGQKQRVALARALVKQPRVLLLDEPLSALDAKLRDAMRLELVKLQETVGVTFVIVTHDQSEALAMADRIAVLESGRLRQVDTPNALYQKPVDAFVADFIGRVHTFATTHIDFSDNVARIQTTDLGTLELAMHALPDSVQTGAQTEASAMVAFRPESVSLALAEDAHNEAPTDALQLAGFLGDIAFQGQHSIVEVTRAHAPSISAIQDHSALASLQGKPLGTPLFAYCKFQDIMLLPAG